MFRVLSLIFILIFAFSLVQADEPTDAAEQPMESVSNASWSFGAGVSYGTYKYEEPGLMDLKGGMLRFNGSATRKIENFHFTAEASVGFSSDDYTGSVTDGVVTIDTTESGIKDHLYEFRGLIGQTFMVGRNSLTASFGYGYRMLDNLLGDIGEAGYDRHSRYQYVPIRLCLDHPLSDQNDGGHVKASLEYDYFVSGKQTSDISAFSYSYRWADTVEIAFQDLENDQNGGHGLKGSLSWLLSKKSDGISFMVTVYYDGWWIDESTKNEAQAVIVMQDPTKNKLVPTGVLFLEPENRTREVGLKLSANWF